MRFLVCALFFLGLVGRVFGNDRITADNVAREFYLQNQFALFKSTYGVSYDNTALENYRFAIFSQNVARAEELAKANPQAQFGMSKFMDLEPAEFKRTFLNYRPPMGQAAINRLEMEVTKPAFEVHAASNIDWRTKGAVTPVKDQGQCGSCWAFSTAEEVESSWYLKHGVLQTLSPQQIVSCDHNGDLGCGGGDTVTAYGYVQTAGLETEKAYPYTSGNTGADGNCVYNASAVVSRITGFTYATPGCTDSCDKQDENTLLNNLGSTAPVSICVYAESWQTYTGGVMTDPNSCPHAYTDLDHCVQLVGYNGSGSSAYWLIRNSWNTNWGEDGYIYVQFGSNLCGVADEATFATSA